MRTKSLYFIQPHRVLLCGLLLIAGLSTSSRAADLEMVDAFGNVTGVVDLSAAGLSVFENNGARWFYRREPRYDLPGGTYLGFYNLELNRAIRFPRSGVGPIQRADLDSPLPQFGPANVSVRLIGSGRGFLPYLDAWQIPPPSDLSRSRTWQPRPILPIPTPLVSPLSPVITQPASIVLSSKLEPLPPLPKAELELFNSSTDRLRVTLTDTQHPLIQPRYDLAPGASQRVRLPRDAGAVRVQTVETLSPLGETIQREVRVPLPPSPRYEIVVHRWRMQSIAIDRTGTSPHPIEDVNFQGVGVGRFMLPAGEQLTSARIDVFARATSAGNSGSVAPLVE